MSTRRDSRFLDFSGMESLVAAGRVAPPSPDAVAAAQLAVARVIEGERAVTPLRRPGRRRLIASAAAVTAVAAAAVILPTVNTGDGTPAGSASAAQFFNSVAEAAQSQGAERGPYWKFTLREQSAGQSARTTTTILSPTGIFRPGDGRKPAPNGRELTWAVGDDKVNWSALAELPTDAKELRARLAEGALGSKGDEQVVRQAGHLLTFSPAGPELRAALYRAMAGTPGVKVTGEVRDVKGRLGTEVTWPYRESKDSGIQASPHWIIDPDHGELLEVRYTARESYDGSGCVPSEGVDPECSPSFDIGDVISTETFLFSGPVHTPR